MRIHHTENYQSTGNSLCDEELPVVTDTLYMAGSYVCSECKVFPDC